MFPSFLRAFLTFVAMEALMLRSLRLLVLLVLVPATLSATGPASDLDSRRKALNDLLNERWEYTMRHSPIYASVLGDKRYNDQLDDFSQQAIDEDLQQERKFLARFDAIDTAGFPEQEILNKLLMVRDLRIDLEGARFKSWEMPVNQMSGIHNSMPQLVNLLSFETIKDYDDYITRLKLLPRLFDQTVIQMRKGMAEGLMPPRILLEKVVSQSDAIGSVPPEKSPYLQPFNKFPDSIPEADRKRLREAALVAIRDSVNPAYTRFTAFVRDEYAPKGRTEPGVWALPEGPERYTFRL